MCGLTPYVDFSDSKGPLLWLIYGISYLFTPRSYHGVFWLGLLAYIWTYWLLYRTAYLVLGRRSKALLASMCMSVPFFLPFWHGEIRAEDFCQPFLALSFLATIQILHTPRQSMRWAVALGISAACTCLIKYSVTLPLLVLALAIMVTLIIRGTMRGRLLIGYLFGVIVIALPFLVYLGAVGALSLFLHDYFLGSANTVAATEGYYPHLDELLWFFTQMRRIILWALPLAGLILCRRLTVPVRWCLGAWLVGTLAVNTLGTCAYYHTIIIILLYPLLLWGVNLLPRIPNWSIPVWGLGIIAIVVALTLHSYRDLFIPLSGVNQYTLDIERAGLEMSNKQHPTLLYWGGMEAGEDLLVEGLPATRFWTTQNGATPAMHHDQALAVLQRRPDYVSICDTARGKADTLQNCGYRPLLKYISVSPSHRILYGRTPH